jgi:hypothetical protein
VVLLVSRCFTIELNMICCKILMLRSGPPRRYLQGGTRLLSGPGDRLRLLSKLRIWSPIKPLVNSSSTMPCERTSTAELAISYWVNAREKVILVNTELPSITSVQSGETYGSVLGSLLFLQLIKWPTYQTIVWIWNFLGSSDGTPPTNPLPSLVVYPVLAANRLHSTWFWCFCIGYLFIRWVNR